MYRDKAGPACAAGAMVAVAFTLVSIPAAAGTIISTPTDILPFVPLIASPSPVTLTDGASTQLLYTFTDNTPTGVYLNVFKAINATKAKACGGVCPTSALLDQKFHVIGPGQSYTYSVPIVTTLGVPGGAKASSVGDSVVQGTIWWEYNLPGRGQLIYKQSTNANIAVAAAPPAALARAALVTPSAVPEPASWALMLAGLGGLGASLRRRRRIGDRGRELRECYLIR